MKRKMLNSDNCSNRVKSVRKGKMNRFGFFIHQLSEFLCQWHVETEKIENVIQTGQKCQQKFQSTSLMIRKDGNHVEIEYLFVDSHNFDHNFFHNNQIDVWLHKFVQVWWNVFQTLMKTQIVFNVLWKHNKWWNGGKMVEKVMRWDFVGRKLISKLMGSNNHKMMRSCSVSIHLWWNWFCLLKFNFLLIFFSLFSSKKSFDFPFKHFFWEKHQRKVENFRFSSEKCRMF